MGTDMLGGDGILDGDDEGSSGDDESGYGGIGGR